MVISAVDSILNKIIRNKLKIVISDGYALPVRFTENQLAIYSSINKNFKARCFCSTGICLDLITDSSYLKLKVSYRDVARKYAYYDLYINDYFVNNINSDITDIEDSQVTFILSENCKKEQKVTIYLPHLVSVYIKEIELEDGCIIKESPKYKKNYLCLGGSIAQGMTAKRPSSMYSVQLARALDMNLLNQGVGGYYFEAKSLDEKLNFNPDMITVAYGGNEWRICTCIADFEKMCLEFMDKLIKLYPNANVFVIPPTWRKTYNNVTNIGNNYVLTEKINSICSRYPKVKTMDSLKLTPHIEYFYNDGVHPTDEGFLYFSINLLSEIYKTIYKPID